MTQIGIVGAGAAAAAASHHLERTTDATVTVLEKSRGLCGRAATRRRDGMVYDYGANYLRSDDDRVVSLVTETLDTDGLVDITEPIWTFDADGSVSEGRPPSGHKWSYRQGLTQLAKRLFARTDADVHRETRVASISREAGDGRWRCTDTDGSEWGPFDVLVLTPPAPQTASLLAGADWNEPERERLVAAVEAVPYRTIWTGIFHYPFALERPYYALVNPGKNHEIGWIAREECKAGHVPDGESLLVVQANHEWSVAHYEEPPAETLATLADLTADVVGDDRLSDPAWTDHQGWRYALPDAAVDREPLEAAETAGLYCVGDWIAGEGRLHAALRTGLDAGERIAARLG